MIDQQVLYFDELSKHRARLADALDDPALRGVKTSVVEKYSDQAHFIYELLQNADDANATSARFVLYPDKLVFAHNGTKRFSISNPMTEEVDSANGALADLNAITSIANSSKREASIGKFGVGFKSVFQYTTTPSIYDPAIFFKINRFIVPERISGDFPGRKAEETLFVFPFDHSERVAEEAYDDIYEKIRSLDYPLLFLTHLKDISFDVSGMDGLYGKYIEQELHFGDTAAEKIVLTQNEGEDFYDEKLWLFSREDEKGNTYSAGFFLDEEGGLAARQHPAFCFFPTKEVTGLNFIVHAPFLLTDSREGIRAGVQHNNEMVALLAELAADSLVYLRDIGESEGRPLITDDLFDLIPYDPAAFSEKNDRRKISFLPFYEAIQEKMSEEALLPARDGYVTTENAYWAFVPQIAELFTDEQLAAMHEHEGARWVFTSFGRQDTRRKNKELTDYIESVTHTWLDEDDMIDGWSFDKSSDVQGGIKAEFIEAQPVEWLHRFYQWASETNTRTELIKEKPIFLNQERKAVPVLDGKGQVVLFMPTDTEGYNTVLPELLENEATAEFLLKLGVSPPSLRDEIYNQILPQYQGTDAEMDTMPHFSKFFAYYQECPAKEAGEFIRLIKECEFIWFRSADEDVVYRGKASGLYFPFERTKKWFEAKPDARFIEFECYVEEVGEDEKEDLIGFFTELGVTDEPRVLSRRLGEEEAYEIRAEWPKSTREIKWTEKYIDGLAENLGQVTRSQDADLSCAVWDQLVRHAEYGYSWNGLRTILQGKCEYFYYHPQSEKFDSTDAIALRTSPWLLNREGEFISADKASVQTLPARYDLSKDETVDVLECLGIERADDADGGIPAELRAKLALAEALADIPWEEIDRFAAQYRASKETAANEPETGDEADPAPPETPVARIGKEIAERASSIPKEKGVSSPDKADAVQDADEDDFTKPAIDYSRKLELAKQRSASEIAEIAYLDELTRKALDAEKYTYGWFKALLELESINSGENNANSREISITFSKVELEKGTKRTLILKHPSRYIPQFMEDLADIPLELHFGDRPMIRAAVEVVNVKSYTLRAKLKTNAQIDGVDLSLVKEARIDAKNPVFLLEELRKSFEKLGFEDDFDMKNNLCENIEFVFGPPGTGKTTYLSGEVILPLLREEASPKILVLTPTNKSADVLVRRLMSLDKEGRYPEWLVRFGATNDAVIEEEGVFRDKTTDIQSFGKNVTVTTIARFTYDYFMPGGGTRLHLSGLNWDYIIIDEASMIPLANVIYPLYKKTPKKFIIAGDPLQIEPITTVDLWKNENIYTMVGLDSFTDPKTVPHPYHVELLTTQYRSTPEIGEVFSRFAYGGVLGHHRSSASRRPLKIESELDIKPLTMIKFPVSKYESIYRPKRLQSRSNYHIYSALFSFEFIKHISSLLEKHNEDEVFRIGLIAPYRAQADLVDKLMASFSLPGNVDVQVGTIHGFQGDECDIIIALFNPPPSISASKQMFLNKLNILNVAISRARDYLFVIMPDDETQNVDNLTMIKKIEGLLKEQAGFAEFQASELEEIMFGSPAYLEENSFSTSHQLVNVYGKPEKQYEVRSEDNAVDVQIHK